MPRLLSVTLALLLYLLPSLAWAIDVPPLRAHVNDNADMLSAEAEAALESKLTNYESQTQRQFALLTIDSLDGDALEDFSIRVVEAWKLGKKGKDDGLLLLIVKNDKIRVEVGYGLEGDITDVFSARVIRQVIQPAFRAGRIDAGVDQALGMLMQKAAGEDVAVAPTADRRAARKRGAPSPIGMLALLFMVLPVVIPLLLMRGRGGRGARGAWIAGSLGGWGGGFGGGGGYGGGGFGGGGGGGGFSGGGGGFGGGGSSGEW